MRGPAVLLRLLIEFVVILLGALLLRLALTGRYFFDRRSMLWIGLGAALVLAGAAALWRSRSAVSSGQDRVRGASHVLIGLIVLGVAAVPFGFVGPLLDIAGGILIVRGLTIAVMLLRTG